MTQVSLQDIREMALESKGNIWEMAADAGHDNPKVYLHWTAGWYHSKFDDYHINIDEDGNYFVSVDDFCEVLAHTWRRNTGSIGITLDCGVYCTTDDLGENPPTEAQIEAMARSIAVICKAWDLPINKQTVLTHGEAADNEDGDEAGYGPDLCYGPLNGCERWDLELLGTPESPEFNPEATDGSRGGDVLRGKAIYYYNLI